MALLRPLRRRPAIVRPALLLLLALAVGLAGALLAAPEPRPVAAQTLFVNSVSVSSAGADNTFVTGDTITVTVQFASPVVGHSGGGVALDIGGTSRTAAPPATISCGQNVTFTYTVVAADSDADGISIAANAIAGTWNTRFNHNCSGPAQQHGHSNVTVANQFNCCETASSAHRVNANVTDYDADDDGLIEVDSLAKLNAIRYDLDGNGLPAGANTYDTAFPAFDHASCPDGNDAGAVASHDCIGYELTANLDFDTDEDGSTYTLAGAVATGDADDAYNRSGAGWAPIGSFGSAYSGVFEGNHHTIANLYINVTSGTATGGNALALFANTGGAVRNVGLVNPYVENHRNAGGSNNNQEGRAAALTALASGGSVSRAYVRGGTVKFDQASATTAMSAACLIAEITLDEMTINSSWASCEVTGTDASGGNGLAAVGGLVGYAPDAIDIHINDSYATGDVTLTGSADHYVGGLLGNGQAYITSSYAAGDVDVSSSSTNLAGRVGGLVGGLVETSSITASYATGDVSATASRVVGGLVGRIDIGNLGNIKASYARGDVTRTGTNTTGVAVGGLVGSLFAGQTGQVSANYSSGSLSNAAGTSGGLVGVFETSVPATAVTHSYWVNTQTGSAGTTTTNYARSATGLPALTGYSGLSASWNQNLDGETGNDDPWYFGTSSQLPIIQYGKPWFVSQQLYPNRVADYDADDDGLIDIATVVQLNAIRHDLIVGGNDDVDGDGDVRRVGAASRHYATAFPGGEPGMGCAVAGGCHGYELVDDLDFDTDDDGDVDNSDDVSNWVSTPKYNANFDGNGYTISNLPLSLTPTNSDWVGLFGGLDGPNYIKSVGLIDPTVNVASNTGQTVFVGALVGQNWGRVESCYVSGGSVTVGTQDSAVVGGLVGRGSGGTVIASYNVGTAVEISGGSLGYYRNGGLVGGNYSNPAGGSYIIASYAASTVTNAATTGSTSVGAITGTNAATITNTYYDNVVESTAMGIGAGTDSGVTAYSTTQLQTPTEYGASGSGSIYENWNVDVDNDGVNDDPWDFVSDSHYPILKYGRGAGGIVRQLAAGGTDYDVVGNNNLIEVGTLAQLDAMRYDLDGDGIPANTAAAMAYFDAYPGLRLGSGMGCASGCQGYELTAHLDFDTDGDGATHTSGAGDADDAYYNGGAGWVPIGAGAGGVNRPYTGHFKGRNYTVSNLFINSTEYYGLGLFANLNGAEVSSLGLVEVYVKGANPTDAGGMWVGALAGDVDGQQSTNIRYVYATGAVDLTVTDTVALRAGGLLGSMGRGLVAASWSAVDVTVASTVSNNNREVVGGLVGLLDASGGKVATVLTSYATGDVTATRNSASGGCNVGGLVGFAWSNRVNITASYAAGTPDCTATGGAASTEGGLLADGLSGSNLRITASYWDSTVFTGASTRGAGKTTTVLQAATDYTATDFTTWDDHNVDGDAGSTADAPWDFGTGSQYPILKFGHDAFSISQQRGGTGNRDYDADGDNLIDIEAVVGGDGLAQLDAVRWDLDGNGLVTGDDALKYVAAFPNMAPGMGCPAGCAGYELRGHLDFDENGDGAITGAGDPTYWNGGNGWAPIGNATTPYAARFDGNGYVIDHLFIDRSAHYVGLFGAAGPDSVISGVALTDVSIDANANSVGALAGLSRGTVSASWSTGRLEGYNRVGGLVGRLGSSNSDTAATVTSSYSTATVSATIGTATYTAGGLVGHSHGVISYSYAAGAVSSTGGTATLGGLVGTVGTGATITASYFDSEATTGSNSNGTGQTASQLQTPIAPPASGTYAGWDTAVWDFGTASQYPVIKHTGRSLAWQGRGGFAVTRNGAAITEPLTLDEGAAAISIGIALATAPENRVGVSVSTDNAAVTVDVDGDNTFGQSELLPTSFLADWDTPKTISIRAAEDADVANIPNVKLTLTAADSVGGQLSGYAGIRRVVDVLVDDDDTAAITLSPTALTVTEEGADGTYTLVLSNQPAADVTVTITNDNSALLSIDTATHTFEAATSGMTNSWDTARTVTVSTMHDGDNTDDVVTLTHTAAGAGSGYDGLTADLRVTVIDDDIPNIELSAASLTIAENATDTYDVELTVAPTANVTVTVTATGATIDGPDTGSDFSATETLTFTPTDYSTAQTITVMPLDDTDLRNAEATIAHRVTATTDQRYTGKSTPLAVPITNTDTGDIVFSVGSLDVVEAGPSVTYGVALDHRPAEDATVAISVSNSNLATVSPDTLTFRRAGWSATGLQTVTVTAPADSNALNNGITLTHEGGNAVSGMSSGYDTPVTAGLTVNVLDSTAPALTLSTTSLGVNDGGNAPYQVQLAAAPASDVTIAITSNDPGRATVNPTSLTFNSGNYNMNQQVMVTTTSDGDNINDAVALTHTPTIQGIVNPATTLPVIIGEANDESVPTRIAAPPAGGSATFNIPGSTGDATVTSGAGVPSGITISTVQALPADLDFTLAAPGPEVPTRGGRYSLNGGSIVDITLGATQSLPTGGVELCLPRGRDAVLLLRYDAAARAWQEVANPVVRGDQVCAVVTEFSVFGAGRPAGVELLRPATLPEFGEGGHAEVTVLVQDTTTESVRVSWAVSGSGGITPGDFGNAANTAPLTSLPTGTITVPAGTNATAVIRIPIYDDNEAEGVERFTVRITQAAGGETDFSSETVTVAIALSDPSLTLRGPSGGGAGSGSGGSGGTGAGDSGSGRAADAPVTESYQLVITEGESNAYTMALSAVPAGEVTVVIHSNHDGVTTNPPSLTFDASNWDRPQRIQVIAAQDGDDKHEQATLTHILTDADGEVIEIIDRLRLFVVDTDPPDDDDIC